MKSVLILLLLMSSFVALAEDETDTVSIPLLESLQGMIEAVDSYWAIQDSITDTVASGSLMELDVDTCVDLALSQNPAVFVSRDETNAAEARIGQARSPLYPQVKVSSGYTYVEGIEDSFGGFSFLGGNLASKEVTRRDLLTISQTLYTGGQIRALLNAAKLTAESEKWREKAVSSDIALRVKTAYYDCILAKAMVKVAEDSVATFAHHLSDAKKNLDVGLVSYFEVLRAKTELGSRKSSEVAARNVERLAYMNLLRILALPMDTLVHLVPRMNWEQVSKPVDSFVKEAFEKRPEILAMQDAIGAAKHNLNAMKAQYKPRAAASAQWSNTDNGGSFTPDGWTVSIGLDWDITVGGKRKHQVVEAKALLDKVEHQLAELKSLIELEVRQAYIQVLDAIAKTKSEKGTVELAHEGRRLAALRFKEGVGTQAEILDAELAVTNSETSLVQALRDFAVAHAALEKARGASRFSRDDDQ